MMKLCICFLVVASSVVSSGPTVTKESPREETTDLLNQDPQPTSSTSPSPVNTSYTIALKTEQPRDTNKDTDHYEPRTNNDTVTEVRPTPVDVQSTTSSAETKGTSKPVVLDKEARVSSWGYVILVLIILVIIILCVILYFLRRVSRTYSFDLRPNPVTRLNEPIGTFEPVYLDELAPTDHVTTDEFSPPPVANGTSLPSEEKASSGESAPQEQPDTNGLESSPVADSSPSPCNSRADKAPSPSTSTNLLFDGVGEEQKNENNNNPIVCSKDPFVEISLDEPALCDQLLTSPQATSSVLPFSFSLTSSSS